ncbi:MAG: glycosyltransferase family 4 protein [Eubacterium sp.]
MLGHKHVPSREGGVEIVVEELSTRMVQMNYDVTCFNRSGHHVSGKEFDSKKQKEYKGIKIKQVFTINRKGFAAMTASVFAAIRAALGKYNVAHFHAEGPCVMLWLPKLLGKRCIVTIHGLDHQRAKWGKMASAYIMIGEKMAVRYADEIIVLSKNVQEYFKNTYGRKTNFIPNGVNRAVRKEPDLIKSRLGLEKDGYILYLGRIVPEKGLTYLIHAFGQVKTDKKLVIAGGASDSDAFMRELKNMAKEDDRIIFTGFVQGKMLDELYSNAYVYTLPSDLEGMPLSLLEAMSYGNCCLVSDIPECADVVEDKAEVFRQGNIKELAAKLQMLCDDKRKVEEYKEQAAEFICAKHNWDRVVERTVELYRGTNNG